MITVWDKKKSFHPEIYEIEGKINLAIYKPQHEKFSFLHMPKGAEKPCDYTGGSEPMFLCILIKNLSALIEKSPKILKSTRTSVCFMDASWLIWSMNSKETLSRDVAHIIDLYLIIF